MGSTDILSAFLNCTPIPGVQFSHNDYVYISSGTHVGKRGSLVSIITLEPEPLFVVELDSGFDVRALQSEIVCDSPKTGA